jgi:hypothetical protein
LYLEPAQLAERLAVAVAPAAIAECMARQLFCATYTYSIGAAALSFPQNASTFPASS